MIFREVNEAEIRILKLLRMHLTLTHVKLARYMEMGTIELLEPINHLEREGLVSADNNRLSSTSVYSATPEGLGLARGIANREKGR